MNARKMPTRELSGAADKHDASESHHNWKDRIVHEVKTLLGMFLYLYVMMALFLLHEMVVLARYDIPFTRLGFAVVHAAILAKVMLIAEDLNIAHGLESKPLVYSVLYKSLVFAIVFIVFYVAEEVLVGMWHGKSVRDSIPEIGGGSLLGVVSVGVIMTFALIPYFVVREISRTIGTDELRALFFTRGPKVAVSNAAGKAAR